MHRCNSTQGREINENYVRKTFYAHPLSLPRVLPDRATGRLWSAVIHRNCQAGNGCKYNNTANAWHYGDYSRRSDGGDADYPDILSG